MPDNLKSTNTSNLPSETTGWELALVGAPSSNNNAVAESKLVKLYSHQKISQSVPCCISISIKVFSFKSVDWISHPRCV